MKMNYKTLAAVWVMTLSVGAAHAALNRTAYDVNEALNFSSENMVAEDNGQSDKKVVEICLPWQSIPMMIK